MPTVTRTQTSRSLQRATDLFRKQGGILRMRALLDAGVHPRTLYALRDAGTVESLSRGLYRLADIRPLKNPDLVAVALRVPDAVVCLISALAFHELTTQIPHAVSIAIPKGKEPPRLDYPPIDIVHMSRASFEVGIETHRLDGIDVRIYSAEKTLADCFKFRNRIGLDTALEALKTYRQRRRRKIKELLQFAEVCRVAKVMRPYLEAIL